MVCFGPPEFTPKTTFGSVLSLLQDSPMCPTHADHRTSVTVGRILFTYSIAALYEKVATVLVARGLIIAAPCE